MASPAKPRRAAAPLPPDLHQHIAPADPGLDHILSTQQLALHCPLDIGKHALQPRADLGRLDPLSAELKQMILDATDVQTLFAFRRVNQRAMATVDALPAFRAIAQHCPDVLRGALAIQTAEHVTLHDLHELLTKAQCARCPNLGGYIDLLGLRRVCHACHVYKDDALPLPAKVARAKFGLSGAQLAARVRCMTTVPGTYGDAGARADGRFVRYDPVSAQAAAREQYRCGSDTAREEVERRQRRGRSEVLYWELARRQERPYGSEPTRYMAIVRAPVVRARPEEPFWGIRCQPCLEAHRRMRLDALDADLERFGTLISNSFRRLYSREEFVKHVEELGPVVEGLHTLDGVSADEGDYEADDESDEEYSSTDDDDWI